MKYSVPFWISTAGGVGLAPKAPGTFGSLVGLILFFGIGLLSPSNQSIVFFLTLALAWWGVTAFERETGIHDDQRIVIDEVLGIWLTLFAFPLDARWLGIGFILFRLFDILKPFPANWIDRKLKGAAGIILDDLVAGLFAQALLRVAYQMWGHA